MVRSKWMRVMTLAIITPDPLQVSWYARRCLWEFGGTRSRKIDCGKLGTSSATFCTIWQAGIALPCAEVADPQTALGQAAQVGDCGCVAETDGPTPLSDQQSGGLNTAADGSYLVA